MLLTMNEKWAALKEFNNSYEISDLGNLRSVKTFKFKGKRYKLMSRRIAKKYFCSNIMVNGESKTVRLHRLVALNFVPNPDNKPFVNHKDGNTLNNAYWNLEWVTHLENTIHAIQNRLTRKPGGRENTLTEAQVLEIFATTDVAAIVAEKYNVCKQTVNNIKNGRVFSWLTKKEYESNDGNRKYVEVNGREISHAQLAKLVNCTPSAITYRLKQGWSVEKILSIVPKIKGIR
jgi:hypothetical protein